MDQQTTSPGASGDDAWQAIPLERWYVEAAEANPHRCDHPGPCGSYFLCSREECRKGGYQTAELLPNGTLLLHCEAAVLTRKDPEYRDRVAGLRSREEAGA